MKPLIVLMSDFGQSDHYVACMKAVILSRAPRARIVDLTHGIQPQNVIQGSVVLKSAYAFFPKGSIFVCVVDPGVGTARRLLCIRTSRYWFIGPDNGLLDAAAAKERNVKVRSIQNRKYFLTKNISSTFHGRDIMAPAAAALFRSPAAFSGLGPRISFKPRRPNGPNAGQTKKGLQGQILYFDHFGNAITSITRDLKEHRYWRSARVYLKGKSLGEIVDCYGPSSRRTVALFNSFDHLELAVPSSSARDRYHLKPGDPVLVKGKNG